jgi:hypothetical protein
MERQRKRKSKTLTRKTMSAKQQIKKNAARKLRECPLVLRRDGEVHDEIGEPSGDADKVDLRVIHISPRLDRSDRQRDAACPGAQFVSSATPRANNGNPAVNVPALAAPGPLAGPETAYLYRFDLARWSSQWGYRGASIDDAVSLVFLSWIDRQEWRRYDPTRCAFRSYLWRFASYVWRRDVVTFERRAKLFSAYCEQQDLGVEVEGEA